MDCRGWEVPLSSGQCRGGVREGGGGCGVVIEPPQCSADNKVPRRRQSFFESCMSNGIVIELNILVLKYLDIRVES